MDQSGQAFMNQGVASNSDIERLSPREARVASAELVIYPESPGKPSRCFALMQDVSRGGFSIVHPVKLVPGQQLDIIFPGKPLRPASVAWCKPLPGKHYSIGCRFMDD